MVERLSGRSERFDDLCRSERYFTATLLPAVLIHNDFAGLRSFIGDVDKKAKRERFEPGDPVARDNPNYDFQNIELITEFHIWRDLNFANLPLPQDAPEKRDAPDLVILAGQELIVCEGKFFSEFGRHDLNQQLCSQRLQVRHLFDRQRRVRAYRHVAILPFVPEWHIDADAVLTWDDIRELSERIMGANHYVTLRLRKAVERYGAQMLIDPNVRNYDGKLSFEEMCERCQGSGNEIWVGHVGGAPTLRRRTLDYVAGRQWKYRDKDNSGRIVSENWVTGEQWLQIVTSLAPSDGVNL